MTLERPDWLPDPISVDGEWEKVLARLYSIFDRDLRATECRFQDLPVSWDRRRLAGERCEEGFWHLITKADDRGQQRLLDPRRAERLPWCKPVIEHWAAPEVKTWDYEEASRKVRTYLWLERWGYVVILEKRQLSGGGRVAFLITAFYVEGNSTRRGLQGKHDRRRA